MQTQEEFLSIDEETLETVSGGLLPGVLDGGGPLFGLLGTVLSLGSSLPLGL